MKSVCHLLLCLLLCLLLGASGCSVDPAAGEQRRFDQYVDQRFVETLSRDYHTMALFLENPQDVGIRPEKVPPPWALGFPRSPFARRRKPPKSSRPGSNPSSGSV